MKSSEILMISEMFYSIQGENPTAGIPMIFVRLTGCNLTCRGWSYVSGSGERLGCDSAEVWRKGIKYDIYELLADWENRQWIEYLRAGARLNFTGGEPLLQQERISVFCKAFQTKYHFLPKIEVETNGTILPKAAFDYYIYKYNVSPKLSSSGDPLEKRYNSEALQAFSEKKNVSFKFVITSTADITEVFTDYLSPLKISKKRIAFMPEGVTAKKLQQKSIWLVKLCMQHVIRYSPRLQVFIWDQTTGV